jgi:predicted ATPase
MVQGGETTREKSDFLRELFPCWSKILDVTLNCHDTKNTHRFMFLRSMNVTFAFSGPCNAGKTTLMHKIKDRFGSKVHIVGECIRDKITSIDVVRNSAQNYFKLQQRVVMEKIRMEDEANSGNGKLILVDRSLADSLFYTTFYIDIKALTDAQKIEYVNFVKNITETAKAKKRYDIVFMMQPLPITVKDPMRPNDLVVTQTIEHQLIETLNIGLFTGLSKLTKVDVRKEEDQILSACEEALSEIE